MRATTLSAAAAIVAAVLASVAALYGPHTSTEYSGTPPSIMTLGLTGDVPPEEVSAILNGSGPGPLPPMSFRGIILLGQASGSVQEYLGSLGEPTTGQPVPGIDEGDILKLAPPYALYVSRETLYLIRLWPPGHMSVADKVMLPSIVREGLAKLNRTWWVPTLVRNPQVLVHGDAVVVAFVYSSHHLPGFIACGRAAEVSMAIGGERVRLKIPVCRALGDEYGTAIAVFKIGEGRLRAVALHLIEGMALIDSRLEGGITYFFLRPVNPVMTGKERVDGVPVLDAGPSYIAAASPYGNSIITVVALNPETGEVGVTNVALPLAEVTRKISVYMRDHTAYILLTGGPGVSDEALAEKMIACADNAPKGLRERLEGLGSGASPGEVLGAVKEWAEDVQGYVLPVIKWLIRVTGGDLTTLNNTMNRFRPPSEYREGVEKAEEELGRMSDFLACVAAIGDGVTASSTRVVRMVFQGLVGSVRGSAEVPGKVLGGFGVHDDGQYLYVLTTEVPGKLYLAVRPLSFSIVYGTVPPLFTDNGSIQRRIDRAEIWGTVHSAINIAWALEWLKAANSLRDIVTAEPSPRAKPSSSLHILRERDLSPVASLTGLAPGVTVRVAKYVGNYLYLVTYERKNPLYAVDIRDPTDPEALGWLGLPGNSKYLYPLGDRYLVGLSTENSTQLMVDLYDISDPTNIVRVSSTLVVPGSLATDHRSFQPISSDAFTVFVTDPELGRGVAVFKVVPSDGLSYLGFLSVNNPLRCATIDGVLYAFGEESIAAADLRSLETVASIRLT